MRSLSWPEDDDAAENEGEKKPETHENPQMKKGGAPAAGSPPLGATA